MHQQAPHIQSPTPVATVVHSNQTQNALSQPVHALPQTSQMSPQAPPCTPIPATQTLQNYPQQQLSNLTHNQQMIHMNQMGVNPAQAQPAQSGQQQPSVIPQSNYVNNNNNNNNNSVPQMQPMPHIISQAYPQNANMIPFNQSQMGVMMQQQGGYMSYQTQNIVPSQTPSQPLPAPQTPQPSSTTLTPNTPDQKP